MSKTWRKLSFSEKDIFYRQRIYQIEEVLTIHFYMVISVLFSLVVAIFAVQNSELVTIRFLLWELPSVPQVVVIILAALAGMGAAFFFSFSRHYRLAKRNRELKDVVGLLEQELSKNETKKDETDTEK